MLLLAGLGAAAELASAEAEAVQQHMRAMRDRLAAGLLAVLPRELVQVNGPADPALQLPNTLSISVKGLSAPSLIQQLAGSLAASSGSACHSGTVSPVLQVGGTVGKFASLELARVNKAGAVCHQCCNCTALPAWRLAHALWCIFLAMMCWLLSAFTRFNVALHPLRPAASSLLLSCRVPQAMRLQPDYAIGTLRLSTGRHTTAADVDRAVQLVYQAACKQGLNLTPRPASDTVSSAR